MSNDAQPPNVPEKPVKAPAKPAIFQLGKDRNQQFQEQRRQNMAARSTLSRLRNRKSDLK